LFPPLIGSTIGRQVTELVYDYLTEVGLSLNTLDDRTFAPRLAKSWEWSRDSLSLAVHLHPNARWHDGIPVRSDDVTFTYRIYTNPVIGSGQVEQLASIDSVTTTDSLTAVFWFKKRYPLQFYDATSQMQILPKHVFGRISPDSLAETASSIDPIGSGRYRFVRRNGTESIELAADTDNYRGAPNLSRLIWRNFGDAEAAARALLAGEADIYDTMRPENVKAAASHPDLKVVMSPGSDYVFMTFNFRKPLFASRDLRRAITMAVDRESMTTNVLDSLARPSIGPTVRYFPSTDTTLPQIAYDPKAAAQMLDSLGWRLDSKSNVRTNRGRDLRFKVAYPSTSKNREQMAVILQEQLRKIGVAVDLDAMEFNTFISRLLAGDFEAAMHNWHLGTSPASIRELWTSKSIVKNGNNLGSYSSSVFDAYVDSAVSAFDPSQSKAYYTRAYQTAIDDAPAIWLYEPKLVLGMSKRIRTAPYRPDAWWWSLGDWYIPENERIARDRIK
jgi:peptide/nickel transport system substrate-binding protein